MKRLYALLLYLFPRAYREEYNEELRTVFDLSLDDAMQAGKLEVMRVVLRELTSLPTAILHQHLRKPSYGLVTQSAILEKDSYMKTLPKIEWEELGSWKATLASLLPLWLFFFAFANISLSLEIFEILAVIAFYLLLPICTVFFLWKGWMTFDLLLYSFFPIPIMFLFDEMDWSYRVSILLFCTLILTIGIVSYQRSLNKDSVTSAWLSLLLAAVATWIFASHAVQNYWQMGGGTPWWVILFSL